MNIDGYIFETSWEVCNKNGGIYTVLSTHAKALHDIYGDKLIFLGPDFGEKDNQYFKEDKSALKAWKKQAESEGLKVRVGRWNVPGEPIVIRVDFSQFWAEKDAFFGELWEKFKVNSLGAVGDYNDDTVFAMAAGKVIESILTFDGADKGQSVAHFHEWQTAGGLLYLKSRQPEIKTVFTTHATTTGRSICFNGKQLYEYFTGYNGDQMAAELGVTNKHSIEKQAAHAADVFTTVSDITAKECEQLIERKAVVTPNGFEADFVPSGAAFDKARQKARKTLIKVTETLTSKKVSKDAVLIATSGRFEWRNKGIDIFLEAMKKLKWETAAKKEIIAYVMVPSWEAGARADLRVKLETNGKEQISEPYFTHYLNEPENNQILNAIKLGGLASEEGNKVTVIYVPCLLDGKDNIFNMSYYDLLIGLDATVFASYYEPWGYTPLESAAFSVPTITTDLAGFGLWAASKPQGIEKGVAVLHRTDSNTDEVVCNIAAQVSKFAAMSDKEVETAREKAKKYADKATWTEFIKHYQKIYDKLTAKKATCKSTKTATKTKK